MPSRLRSCDFASAAAGSAISATAAMSSMSLFMCRLLPEGGPSPPLHELEHAKWRKPHARAQWLPPLVPPPLVVVVEPPSLEPLVPLVELVVVVAEPPSLEPEPDEPDPDMSDPEEPEPEEPDPEEPEPSPEDVVMS